MLSQIDSYRIRSITEASVHLPNRLVAWKYRTVRLNTILIVSTGNSKLDEARRKREEKKMQRQRELEARRAARSAGGAGGPSGGPMKLGAKKIQLD